MPLEPIDPHTYDGLNNIAKIFAAIQISKKFPTEKLALCTDSSTVHLDAIRKARKWALNNWVGSRGPGSTVELWKDRLQELDSHSQA